MFALPDHCEVALDQQLRRRFRHRTEQFGTRIAVCDAARAKVPSGLRRNAHTLGMIQRDARAADLIEHRLAHATRSVFETALPYKSPHATAIALRMDGVTLHAARVVVARYPGGHMPFLGEEAPGRLPRISVPWFQGNPNDSCVFRCQEMGVQACHGAPI